MAEQQLAQPGEHIAQLFRCGLVAQLQRGPQQPPVACRQVDDVHPGKLRVRTSTGPHNRLSQHSDSPVRGTPTLRLASMHKLVRSPR